MVLNKRRKKVASFVKARRGHFNKRGISAVVATVLIILIVIALIAILWIAIIPMLRNSLDYNFDVNLDIKTSSGYTYWDADYNGGTACVQIQRADDETELSEIRVVFIVDGDSVTRRFGEGIPLGPNSADVKCFELDGKPTSIKVYPVFGNGKEGAILSTLNRVPNGNVPSGTGVEPGVAVCPNSDCESGEDCSNCADCACDSGFTCDAGVCVVDVVPGCDGDCDDGNECTQDVCGVDGTCVNDFYDEGTGCSLGVCDGAGACVEARLEWMDIVFNAISLWNFEEGSGTVVGDVRGNYNGVLRGDIGGANVGQPPTWVSGRFGQGLHFEYDGLGTSPIQYIEFGDIPQLAFDPDNDEFTISLWARKHNNALGSFVTNCPHDGSSGYCLLPGIRVWGRSGGDAVEGTTTISEGVWHQIVLRNWDDGGAKKFAVYVDGALDSPIGVSGSSVFPGPFRIGRRGGRDYGYPLEDAELDEVIVWGRALSEKEIEDLYFAVPPWS